MTRPSGFLEPNGEGGCYTCGHAVDGEHSPTCPRRAWGAVVTPTQVSWTWRPTDAEETARIDRNRQHDAGLR